MECTNHTKFHREIRANGKEIESGVSAIEMKEAFSQDSGRALAGYDIIIDAGLGVIARGQFAIPVDHTADLLMNQIAVAGVNL